MRNVRLFKGFDLLVGQLEVDSCDSVLEVMGLGGANDRSGHYRLAEQPGQRDRCTRNAFRTRDFGNPLDDFTVRLRRVIQRPAEFVPLRSRRLLIPVPRKSTAGKGTPRNDPYTLVCAERQHLAFFLTVKQVVVVLHRDETRPVAQVRGVQRLAELPRKHGRRTDVARLASLDDIVQRFERLFDGSGVVPTVNLIQIHIIRAEAAEAVVDLSKDRLARKARAVWPFMHAAVHFRRKHDLFTLRQVTQSATNNFLAGTVGVDVGGVEEIDAELERSREEWSGSFFAKTPWMAASFRFAVAHAT